MNDIKVKEWINNKDSFDNFFANLKAEDKHNLLKNQEFREFLCNNHKEDSFYYFIKQLTENEIDLLFDKSYIDYLWTYLNDNTHFFKDVYSSMDSIELNHFLSNCKANEIQIYSLEQCFDKLSDENKFKVLDYMLFEMRDFDNVQIGALMSRFYSISYMRSFEDQDFSKNRAQIKWLSERLQDKELAKKFIESKSIMLSLDPENCYALYENVEFERLTFEAKSIIVDLLYSNDMCKSKFPKNIIENKSFMEFIAKNKDWSEYKQIMDTIKYIDISAYKKIDEIHNVRINNCLSKFMQIKDGEDYLEFEGETYSQFADFKDAIFQKYFKSYALDVYMSACVILDAINTLPGYKEKISRDGCELIERLVVSFFQETKGTKFDYKSAKNFGRIDDGNIQNIYNLQEIVKILDTRDDWGDMFNKAMKQARTMFSKNLTSVIFDPSCNEGGQIIDITKTPNFKLLVHDQKIYERHAPIKPLPDVLDEHNISMSLLDNNHLRTFVEDDDSVVFGYSNIETDSIMHALPQDSFTYYCSMDATVQKKKTAQAVTDYLPSYIDIDSFMAQTIGYNEIKVQARENAVDKHGRSMFMPSYIFCRDDIRDIDKRMAEFYNLPIVYVDTKNVEKNPEPVGYEPFLHKIMGYYTSVSMRDSSILV